MEYKFTEMYQNWIKGTLALAHLREGLAPAVVKAMQDGYAVYVSRITQKCKISRYSCTSCSIVTLIPAHNPTSCKYREKERCNCSTGTNKCPQSGACGEFYDYIVKAHAYNSPFWNNCDFQKISHNFWHFAKCFISGHGKNNIECSDDTDPADMLSICLHYRKLRDQFSSEDVLKKAKEVRNDILHSGKMELTKDDVNAYIDVLIAVLKEKPCQETPHVENGYIIKLERLKRETFVVSEKAYVCAHRDGVKAVLEIIEILHTLKDTIECIDSTDDRLAHGENELLLNCRTPEEINERLDTLCAIEKEHKDKLEKHKEQCEQIKAILDDIGILKTIKETTRETNAAVKIVHNDVQELKTMLADINKYLVSCTVPIPDGYAMAECGIPSIEKSTDEEGETNCFACLESKLNSEAGLFCNDCKHFYCNSCVNGHNAFFQRHKLSWDWDTDNRGMMGLSAEANMSENFEEFQLCTESTLRSKASDDVPEQYCATAENFIHEKCDLHPSQKLVAFCKDDKLLCCNICMAKHRLLKQTMIELTEEEKLTERNADVVKRALQDCSDIIGGLINKLQDQTLEAVEKLKSSVSEDLLAQKKRSHLKSINNVVAKDTVDETTAFIGQTKGNTILSDARILIKEIEGRYRFHGESFEQTFRVAEKSEVNVTMSGDTTHNCDITAVCEFPYGIIVLADAANSNLKLLNESFQLLTRCKVPGPPLDMCLIEDTRLAVVTTGHVYFYVLQNDGLRPESSIDEIHHATGIAYFGCQLYIAKKTALFKYSLDVKNEKRIYKDKDAGSKVTVSRCAISRDGQCIYVTGPDCPGLLVLDILGNRLTIVKHDDLVSPRMLQVTPSGHVFVCGSGSQAVMQLDRKTQSIG